MEVIKKLVRLWEFNYLPVFRILSILCFLIRVCEEARRTSENDKARSAYRFVVLHVSLGVLDTPS